MIDTKKGGPIPKGLVPRCEPDCVEMTSTNPDIFVIEPSYSRLNQDRLRRVNSVSDSKLELHR